jgi:hypothetical protein
VRGQEAQTVGQAFEHISEPAHPAYPTRSELERRP